MADQSEAKLNVGFPTKWFLWQCVWSILRCYVLWVPQWINNASVSSNSNVSIAVTFSLQWIEWIETVKTHVLATEHILHSHLERKTLLIENFNDFDLRFKYFWINGKPTPLGTMKMIWNNHTNTFLWFCVNLHVIFFWWLFLSAVFHTHWQMCTSSAWVCLIK